MRHKYSMPIIVLQRAPLSDASALLTILARDVGLVRARAQGVRKPGAKLASALATFAESEAMLVAGKEGWRISGAHLSENWFTRLSHAARVRAGRVATLMMRLVSGEAPDSRIFDSFKRFLETLAATPEDKHEAAECLAALELLSYLGLDAGTLPSIEEVHAARKPFIIRVNRGITASGL